MDNQQERLEFEIGWLMGVWESEGWYSLRSCFLDGDRLQRYRPEIGITNTDSVFLEKVESILRKLNLPFWRTKWSPETKKRPRSMIKIDGVRRCKKFIDRLFPYAVTKRDRLTILKEFIDYRLSLNIRAPYGKKEHTWYQQLRLLNAPLSQHSKILNDYTPNTEKRDDIV